MSNLMSIKAPISIPAVAAKEDVSQTKRRQIEASTGVQTVTVLCAAFFRTPVEEINALGRNTAKVALVRQVVMYICYTSLSITMPKMSKCLNRDRTTISHGIEKVETMRDDPSFDASISELERLVDLMFD